MSASFISATTASFDSAGTRFRASSNWMVATAVVSSVET
jgi:hypothetical protein